MTMRTPQGHMIVTETVDTKPRFDAGKQYEYTWPGQPPRVVRGKELQALIAGADHAQLNIREIVVDTDRLERAAPVALPESKK